MCVPNVPHQIPECIHQRVVVRCTGPDRPSVLLFLGVSPSGAMLSRPCLEPWERCSLLPFFFHFFLSAPVFSEVFRLCTMCSGVWGEVVAFFVCLLSIIYFVLLIWKLPHSPDGQPDSQSDSIFCSLSLYFSDSLCKNRNLFILSPFPNPPTFGWLKLVSYYASAERWW